MLNLSNACIVIGFFYMENAEKWVAMHFESSAAKLSSRLRIISGE